MEFRTIWRRVATTRYTRNLECEVARLRAENRALLNSILGIAGVTPITVTEPELAAMAANSRGAVDTPTIVSAANELSNLAAANGADARAAVSEDLGRNAKSRAGRPEKRSTSGAQAVPLVRRRSWQQVNRGLELNSAKKSPPEAKS